MVPCSQNVREGVTFCEGLTFYRCDVSRYFFRRENDRYPRCCDNSVLGVVHREGKKHRSDHVPAFEHSRVQFGLGNGREPDGLYQ